MKAETVSPALLALFPSFAAGTLAGIPLVCLAAGLGGGVFVMTTWRTLKWWQAFTTLTGTTLVGGFLGPVIAALADAWLKTKLPAFIVADVAMLGACSFTLGIASQVFWNSLVAAGNARIRSLGGPKP